MQAENNSPLWMQHVTSLLKDKVDTILAHTEPVKKPFMLEGKEFGGIIAREHTLTVPVEEVEWWKERFGVRPPLVPEALHEPATLTIFEHTYEAYPLTVKMGKEDEHIEHFPESIQTGIELRIMPKNRENVNIVEHLIFSKDGNYADRLSCFDFEGVDQSDHMEFNSIQMKAATPNDIQAFNRFIEMGTLDVV